MIDAQIHFKNSYINSFFNADMIADTKESKQKLSDSIKNVLLEFILATFTNITESDIELDIKFCDYIIDNENISCSFWIQGRQIPLNLESVVLGVVESKSWIVEYNEYIVIHNTFDPIIMRVYSDGGVNLFNKKIGEHGNTKLVEQTGIRDKLILKTICNTVTDKLDPLI